jgi:hypothetical protein
MKMYSRKNALKSIFNNLDIKIFNAKFEIFSLKCAIQKSILNSALINDNLTGYKNSLKSFIETKKRNKKVIKDFYLKRGI